jgi:hypothetical protein
MSKRAIEKRKKNTNDTNRNRIVLVSNGVPDEYKMIVPIHICITMITDILV